MNSFCKKLPVFLIVFALWAGKPIITNATMLTYVSDFFNTQANAETSIDSATSANQTNSQNMPLLKAIINLDPNPLRKSVDLAIVADSALRAEVGPLGTIADVVEGHNGQISIYVVKKGDSLSEIANSFNVSVNTIIWANDLKGSSIREGQTLVILPISGVRHTVRSGETLRSIVTKYKADINEVMDYNNLTLDSVLSVGDVLTIPDGEISASVTEKSPSNTSTSKVTSKPHDTNGPSFPGYYIRPIVGGYRAQGLHGFNAVDLAASVGTPIRASAAGTVIVSSYGTWNGGYGNYVVIAHANGTQTLYAHASKLLVSRDDVVNQGDEIALVGSTGHSTGPHVHFEIRGAKNPF